MRLLDTRFKYTPSTSTNIMATWRRFGYRPTTEAERAARQRRIQCAGIVGSLESAGVTTLQPARRKVPPALRLTMKK